MGKFSFSGSTPKKVLYNGVEVKKILFNNVEVWRKAIEAGSKFVGVGRGETKILNFTVPDGVTKLKMTANDGYNEIFTVTPGENVNFRFQSFPAGMGNYYTQYSFNGSGMIVIGSSNQFTVSWSEEINNLQSTFRG